MLNQSTIYIEELDNSIHKFDASSVQIFVLIHMKHKQQT